MSLFGKTSLVAGAALALSCAGEPQCTADATLPTMTEYERTKQEEIEGAWAFVEEIFGPEVRSQFSLPPDWHSAERWRNYTTRVRQLIDNPGRLFDYSFGSTDVDVDSSMQDIIDRLNDRTVFENPRTLAELIQIAEELGRDVVHNLSSPESTPELIMIGDIHTLEEEQDARLISYCAVSGSRILLENEYRKENGVNLAFFLDIALNNNGLPTPAVFLFKHLAEPGRRNIHINGTEEPNLYEDCGYLHSVEFSMHIAGAYFTEKEYGNIELCEAFNQCFGLLSELHKQYQVSLREEYQLRAFEEELNIIRGTEQQDYIIMLSGKDHFCPDAEIMQYIIENNIPCVYIAPRDPENIETYNTNVARGLLKQEGIVLELTKRFVEFYDWLCARCR